MQVSVETTSSIERRMTIGVPASNIEGEVDKRLHEAARTVRVKGFRPGKVPLKVVRQQYGKEMRREALGEVMRVAYLKALEHEKINPVGYPKFEAEADAEQGKDFEFTATVEVYPEIELGDMSALSFTKLSAEVGDKEVEKVIESLREQQAKYQLVERPAAAKDRLTADYVGKVDGEVFEGGTATDAEILIGSGQMIPGFEDGLIGVSAGESKVLELTFPEQYQNEALAGKAAQFEVTVKEVEEPVLPELNEEFFAMYGVTDGGLEKFTTEVTNNMNRELKQSIENKVKQQVVDQLVGICEFAVPQSLIDQEIDRAREEAIQQFGGSGMKASDLPAELFSARSEKRVRTGLIFSEIVKQNDIRVDASRVDARIAEMASTYQTPEDVIEWYSTNSDQRAEVETMVIEEIVVETVLAAAKVTEESVSYEDAVKPEQPA